VIAEQDVKGMHGQGGLEEIKKNLNYGGEEGLKIGNAELDEDKDEEAIEINQALKDEEGHDMDNLSSLLSGGI
jgi:hypothetical protein